MFCLLILAICMPISIDAMYTGVAFKTTEGKFLEYVLKVTHQDRFDVIESHEAESKKKMRSTYKKKNLLKSNSLNYNIVAIICALLKKKNS